MATARNLSQKFKFTFEGDTLNLVHESLRDYARILVADLEHEPPAQRPKDMAFARRLERFLRTRDSNPEQSYAPAEKTIVFEALSRYGNCFTPDGGTNTYGKHPCPFSPVQMELIHRVREAF
jgi:hypothetical protein